jgi:hypothetical protein
MQNRNQMERINCRDYSHCYFSCRYKKALVVANLGEKSLLLPRDLASPPFPLPRSPEDRYRDITRSYQAKEEKAHVNELFDGTLSTTYFPVRGVPKKVNPRGGDQLNIIHRGEIVGRCRITKVEVLPHPTVKKVGSKRRGGKIKARCLVHVKCPGGRAPHKILERGYPGFHDNRVPLW